MEHNEDVIYERCAGIDVHKKMIVVCLRIGNKTQVREFGTLTYELREMTAWLKENGCQMAAMESTGSFWKPLYNIFELEGLPAMVVNAQHMPHKGKASAEEKLRIVEDYLSGKVGCSEASRNAGVDERTVRRWVSRYRTEGPTGFMPQERNRRYSKDAKLAAVMDYLAGKGSLQQICEQYKIRSSRQLEAWLKVYNRHEDFKELSGGSHMTKGRETTIEERLEIVRVCIAGGNDYGGSTHEPGGR